MNIENKKVDAAEIQRRNLAAQKLIEQRRANRARTTTRAQINYETIYARWNSRRAFPATGIFSLYLRAGDI